MVCNWRIGIVLLSLLVLGAGDLGAQKPEGQELDQASFLDLHQALEPKDEQWKSIPWEVDLLKAREMAAQSNKPIFMWAMDGHPLGCT